MRSLPWIVLAAACVAGPDAGDPDDTDPRLDDDPLAVTIAPSVPDLGRFPAPVDGELRLIDTFGPRRLDRSDRDDFHQGLDLMGALGDPVRAIAPGRVFRVVPTDGNGDGNTLYTVHDVAPFVWQGVQMDRFFVQYGHLDSFALQEDDPVEAGTVIGAMGDTSATYVHVHVEVRLGGHCSLRYQVRNPDSTCGDGVDPSVHPLHLFGPTRPGGLDLTIEQEDPLVMRLQVSRQDTDWTRLETDAGVLDFDLKQGIDATTKGAMDELEYGWVRVEPEALGKEDASHEWRLHFAERPAYVQVTDVHGAGRRIPLD